MFSQPSSFLQESNSMMAGSSHTRTHTHTHTHTHMLYYPISITFQGMFNMQVWCPGLFFSQGLLKPCSVTVTSTSQAISRELWEERFFQKVLETWPDERCREVAVAAATLGLLSGGLGRSWGEEAQIASCQLVSCISVTWSVHPQDSPRAPESLLRTPRKAEISSFP